MDVVVLLASIVPPTPFVYGTLVAANVAGKGGLSANDIVGVV